MLSTDEENVTCTPMYIVSLKEMKSDITDTIPVPTYREVTRTVVTPSDNMLLHLICSYYIGTLTLLFNILLKEWIMDVSKLLGEMRKNFWEDVTCNGLASHPGGMLNWAFEISF